MIARNIATKPTDSIHQKVVTKPQSKDPGLDYVICDADRFVINCGRCINSLLVGSFISCVFPNALFKLANCLILLGRLKFQDSYFIAR